MIFLKSIRLFALSSLLLIPFTLQAEVIGYLHLEGISGPVGPGPYGGAIEISGFGEGIEVPYNVSGGSGQTAGHPVFSPLRITKLLDITSPVLYLKTATGTRFPEATIDLVDSNGYNYFSIILTDAIITHIVPSVGSTAATEMVSLLFGLIHWVSKPEGKAPIETGWDLTQNQAL